MHLCSTDVEVQEGKDVLDEFFPNVAMHFHKLVGTNTQKIKTLVSGSGQKRRESEKGGEIAGRRGI